MVDGRPSRYVALAGVRAVGELTDPHRDQGRASHEDPVLVGRTSNKRRRNGAQGQSSDHEFNPEEADDDDDEVSGSDDSPESNREELEELRERPPKRQRLGKAERISYEPAAPRLRRREKTVDYRLIREELPPPEEMVAEQPHTPSRRGRGGVNASSRRSLFSTSGPFGGAGGLPPVFGGPAGLGAAGGADSDSSDDERAQRLPAQLVGVGMTPTTALGSSLLPIPQTHNSDPLQGTSATTANLGKIKDRKALADADPLGVDQNISFESVGGLHGHINQLKEMVTLPLLYPEIFQRYHLTPPRGVLFHGPPGTGKTLLARALAATVSSQGQKITFYMRKGADALSKWVGEAERQLRLLFEEARANQPSIIFFDEIDGGRPEVLRCLRRNVLIVTPQVWPPFVRASKSRSTPRSCPPFSLSWMVWTAAVRSLSSVPPIVPTPSTLPFAGPVGLIASSTSPCRTRTLDEASSTSTPRIGNRP